MDTNRSDASNQPNNHTKSRAKHLCEKALQEFRACHCDDALAVLEKAIRPDSDCIEAYRLQHTFALSQGQWDKDVAALTEFLRLCPTDTNSLVLRSMAYNYLKQYEKAIIDCDKAIELDSMCADAYSERACAFIKLGQGEKSDADMRRAFLLGASKEEIDEHDRQELIASLLLGENECYIAG